MEYIFGDAEGYLCVATGHRVSGNFKQFFYEWPRQAPELSAFLDLKVKDHNVWFCVNLLTEKERRKINCLPGKVVWADLDYINPDEIIPPPSCVIESSPKRFQSFWRLEDTIPADVAESFSKKIAYATGADKSGWPLTKLLRVPHTKNFKYENPPEVKVVAAHETRVPFSIFESIPDAVEVPQEGEYEQLDIPDIKELADVQSIVYAHRSALAQNPAFTNLFVSDPPADADWSALLWRFINICFEAGMEKEEVFALAVEAKCNKYARDNRPISHLWKDVLKASANQSKIAVVKDTLYSELKMPRLMDEDDFVEDNFIAEYKNWGRVATDAPEHYHELACFIALSALTSSGLYLSVDFGEIVPNLWGLILGESTLTRKTTVMKMAMGIVQDLDEEVILATDGSAEGLLSGLANRPARVSMFFKDEVSGFFNSINKKDYLAGMPETLTQLYDVPPFLQRLLRKETITITKPYFIFFGGGIRDKVYSLIDEEYILSGFLPRFLVVSGENDLARIRRTGPPTADSFALKQKVLTTFGELKVNYNVMAPAGIGGGQTVDLPVRVEAKLTDKAWSYYGDLEMHLITKATESAYPMVALPTFQRLSFSMLKMAMLIAITRRDIKDNRTIVVEQSDVKQAAFYIQKWGKYSVDLIANAGKPHTEKLLEKISLFVAQNPNGVTKSAIMLRYRLTSREMKEIISTLLDRGVVNISQKGNATRLYPVG